MDGMGPMRLDTKDAADPRQVVTVFSSKHYDSCMHAHHAYKSGRHIQMCTHQHVYIYISIQI